MIRKIEARRGSWINLQADLTMNFSTPQGKKASCRAELVYDRLDEKILLKGFNDKKDLLFIFKTDDRNFELYLPGQSADYSGSIFDLEDSPDIHSHLKALDLYRALKPLAVPEDKAKAAAAPEGTAHLEIKGPKGPEREIFSNGAGDVFKEIYYVKNAKEIRPKTVLERSDFERVQKNKKEGFYFPRRVLIESLDTAAGTVQKTELIFKSAKFSGASDPAAFDFNPPGQTRRVDISEEFKKQRALAG